MNEYAKFLSWSHDRLCDVDWCQLNFKNDYPSSVKMDSDLPGKEYNYYHHRYFTTFFQTPATFYYNTASTKIQPKMLALYNKEHKTALKQSGFHLVEFKILENGLGFSELEKLFKDPLIAQQEWVKCLYTGRFPFASRYWLTLEQTTRLKLYKRVIEPILPQYFEEEEDNFLL